MRGFLAVLTAAVTVSLIACSSASPGARLNLPPPSELPASDTSHAVVIVMENKERDEVMDPSRSPYLTKLASRYAQPERMYGIRHPSLPNYLALIGGGTFGIDSNCTGCRVSARSLPDQLEAAGFTWRGYMEGLPYPCYKGASHERYAKKHNPFLYFDAIRNSDRRCANVVSYKRLESDLRNGTLPDFVFITPDLCNDTHDCGVRTGDRHLEHIVPPLLRELGPRGILFVTYDEGHSDRGCCGLAKGGRIATVVAGPDVRRGVVVPGRYTLYSILRTVEEAFGVPLLRKAGAEATLSMAAHFKRSHRGAMRKRAR